MRCVLIKLLVVWVGISTLAVAATPPAVCPVQVGDRLADVLNTVGAPSRRVETGDGQVLFYSRFLLFIVRDQVQFISIGDPSCLPGAPTLETPGLPASMPPPGAARTPPRDELTLQREPLDPQQERLLARAKRFALSRAYAGLNHDFVRRMPLATPAGCIVSTKDARGREFPAYGNTDYAAWYALGITVRDFVMSD